MIYTLSMAGSNQIMEVDESYIDGWLYPGSVWLNVGPKPAPVYHQDGDYWCQPNATWLWIQTFPVHEYPVTVNSSTGEVHWQVWPDQVDPVTPAKIGAATAASVTSLQGTVTGLSSSLSSVSTVASGAATAASAAQTTANTGVSNAATAKTAADNAQASANSALTAIAALPPTFKWEIVTVTLGTGGASTATFTKTYNTERVCLPIANWSGNVQLNAVLGTPTATGVSVTGKKSVGTIVLSAAPFTDCVSGDVVKFLVMGR